MFVRLPLGEVEPDERVRLIAEQTREWKPRAREQGTLEFMPWPDRGTHHGRRGSKAASGRRGSLPTCQARSAPFASRAPRSSRSGRLPCSLPTSGSASRLSHTPAGSTAESISTRRTCPEQPSRALGVRDWRDWKAVTGNIAGADGVCRLAKPSVSSARAYVRKPLAYAACPACCRQSAIVLTSRTPRVTGGSQRVSTTRSRSPSPRSCRNSTVCRWTAS